MGLDGLRVKKSSCEIKKRRNFFKVNRARDPSAVQVSASEPETQALSKCPPSDPETQAPAQVSASEPKAQVSHHPAFFPFSGPVSCIRNQKVSGPADGNGAPDHGNSKTGSAGHGDDDADGQVDQVGDGEHDHITGTAQETVYGHFKTDHTEEPSHESEVTFSGQKGFCGTVGTKEKSNQWMMEAFHTDAQDDSTEDDHPDSSMIAFYNTVRLSGTQILCSVGRDRISNA